MENKQQTVGQRFAALIKELKLSNNSFAKSLGKSSTTINYIVDEKNKPGFDVLENIFRVYPNLNPDWLMNGEGQMFKSGHIEVNKADNYLQDHLAKLEENFAKLLEQLHTKDHQLETKDKQIASLQESQKNIEEMLKMVLGKLKGVPFRPSRTLNLQQSGNHGVYALPGRPN